MKKLRTNSKEVKEAFRWHIIENITDDGLTIREALENVEADFQAYYRGQVRKRYPNRQEAFVGWAWGLPTSLNSLWKTHEILEFMESIGLPLPENKEPSEGCDKYMYLLYREYQYLLENHTKKEQK